jgi:hypothetical protein
VAARLDRCRAVGRKRRRVETGLAVDPPAESGERAQT